MKESVERIMKGISDLIVLFLTGIALKRAARPRQSPTFAMLLPTTFEMAMLV